MVGVYVCILFDNSYVCRMWNIWLEPGPNLQADRALRAGR